MNRYRSFLAAGVMLVLCGCSEPPETLARVGDQTLTVADLDAYLLTLPPEQREIPPAPAAAGWLEAKLRRLALERHLAASAEMARFEESPEAAVSRLRIRSQLLANALLGRLAEEAAPAEDEVAAKVEEVAALYPNEPVLDFQHLFLRTDRAADGVRQRAEELAARARDGADFSALAREHSQSADAATGGLVRNARSADLDPVYTRALAALAEGEVSPVVESRTGLHVFRLVRRLDPEPPSDAQLAASARALLQRERMAAARQELIAELRRQRAVETAEPPWRIGERTVDAATLALLLPGFPEHEPAAEASLVDQLLLAEEAAARGLATPEIDEQVVRTSRLMLLERLFQERRRTFDASLGEDRLRPYYDAQPSLFSSSEKVRLELIFVPQGRDAFATQQRLEGHVAELRAGASFAALARQISTGPGAESGGDLGLLEPRDLQRYGPAVAAAVAQLEEGEISDPIYCTGRLLSPDPLLLRGGFAILRLGERLPPRQRSFEEAIDDVRRVYAAQHRQELDEELQDQVLEAAGFELLRVPEPAEFLG